MVVLDTCCLVELCRSSPSISEKGLGEIEKGASILSVSFAELALKIGTGRLVIGLSARDLFDRYAEIASVRIVALGVEEWFDAIDLNWKHRDPADRLIVAYARRIGAPIVTSDRIIARFYKNVLW